MEWTEVLMVLMAVLEVLVLTVADGVVWGVGGEVVLPIGQEVHQLVGGVSETEVVARRKGVVRQAELGSL